VRKIIRISAMSLTGLLATLGMALGSFSPVGASATGCSWWGGGNVGGYYVPTAQYCFSISGSGTRVNSTSGSYNSPWGNVCNWREVVSFYNSNGQNYKTIVGSTHYGCWRANWESLPINGTAQKGYVVGQLQTNGQRLTEVRHNIY
jgi:hypothetical protein